LPGRLLEGDYDFKKAGLQAGKFWYNQSRVWESDGWSPVSQEAGGKSGLLGQGAG